jgi:hypothetical protein
MNTNLFTWQNAYDYCVENGAALLNFQNQSVYDFFKSEFLNAEFWIGLRLINGRWLWTSDNSTFYDPSIPSNKSSWWNVNEPSVDDKFARLNNRFELWARESSAKHKFLCQMI